MPFDGPARWQIDLLAADKTAQAFASVDRRVRGLQAVQVGATQAMSAGYGALARALAPLAAALTAASLAHRIWSAGMVAANLGEHAAQVGLSTDALQAYRLAAAQNGVEVAGLDTALMRLTKTMGEARDGSDNVIDRFERMGVKLLDNDGQLRRTADVLPEVARGLLKIGSETERNALMMEIFGRSGGRMVTMLEAFARGEEEVTAAAREQGAIISGSVIASWDALDDRLKTVNQQMVAFNATVGEPLALGGLWALEEVLRTITKAAQGAGLLIRALGADIPQAGRDAAIALKQKQLADLDTLLNHPARAGADQSRLLARRDRLADELESLQARPRTDSSLLPEFAPTQGETGGFPDVSRPGVSNPTGDTARKAAGGAGTKAAADQARETQKAMDDLFASIEKVRKASEGVMDRFGDGAAFAARETAELNDMLQMGFLDADTYARAIADVTLKSDDMARAFRGASGGADAFIAGIEQGMADMARANSLFELGKRGVDELSQAIGNLATGAETDFGRILLSFGNMLIQMELQAMASNLWNMFSGKGPTDQGIGGFLSGLLGGIGGGGGGFFDAGPIAVDGIPTIALAGGGDYRAGVPRLVGEDGWELDVPRGGGTIYNQDQLRSMLGGGGGGAPSITIYNTNQFGSVVSRAEMDDAIRRNSAAQREAVTAGVLDTKTRGGDYRQRWKR